MLKIIEKKDVPYNVYTMRNVVYDMLTLSSLDGHGWYRQTRIRDVPCNVYGLRNVVYDMLTLYSLDGHGWYW